MSRIGKVPVAVPAGVTISVNNEVITVKGAKGTLSRPLPGGITVTEEAGTLLIGRPNDERQSRALHGLMRTLISNMVVGVSTGFTKELEIQGVGYRAAAPNPKRLELALGFSHPVHIDAPEGIEYEVPAATRVIVKGIDKEAVGQAAANIRKIRKPEPYKGKGVRYLGEVVRRKAGKTAKK